jgi:hypothetical protein
MYKVGDKVKTTKPTRESTYKKAFTASIVDINEANGFYVVKKKDKFYALSKAEII